MRAKRFVALALLIWTSYFFPVAHATQPQDLTLRSILDEASDMAQTPTGMYRFHVMMDIVVLKAKLGDRQEAMETFHRGIKKS